MPIGFIHPPLAVFPSGGNHYNAKILQHAKRNNFPIDSLSVDESLPLDEVFSELELREYHLIVLDSFFISAFFHDKLHTNRPSIALLLHDLPSQNPMLSIKHRRITEKAETTIMSLADRFIVTGGVVKTALLKRYPEKPIAICEPGVDPTFHNDLKTRTQNRFSNPVQWLTVANLIPRKGYQEILKISARLSDQNWHWHVVGDENMDRTYAKTFRQSIKHLGLSQRITVHGPMTQHQIVFLMKKSDIFVFASGYETYGMVLAEAATMQIPIVATCVGEAEQLIQHGETGYLAGFGEWDRFEAYLSALTENPQLRHQFRTCRRLESRTWEQTFSDFRKACE